MESQETGNQAVVLDPLILAAILLKYGERNGLFTVLKETIPLIPEGAQLRIYQDEHSYNLAVTFPDAEKAAEPPAPPPVIYLPERFRS